MTRRLLAILIALVGTAGVVVAGLATFFPMEDRATFEQAGPIGAVEVDVEAGRVELVAAEGTAAKVIRTRRYLQGAPVVREAMVDGVFRLEAQCRRFVAVGCRVDHRVEVPAGVTVRVRSDRGSVSVTGLTGIVEIDAGAGDVRLTGTRGPVKVDSAAGRVDGDDLVAMYLDASTDAGPIHLSFAEPAGRIGLKSGAGNIDVALPAAEGGYRVAADAGAGNVDVTVEQNPGGNRAVIASSTAGNIRVHTR
jgi:hypothetical protein